MRARRRSRQPRRAAVLLAFRIVRIGARSYVSAVAPRD